MPPSTPHLANALFTLLETNAFKYALLREAGFIYEPIMKQLAITYRQVQHTCQTKQTTPKKRSGRPASLTDS